MDEEESISLTLFNCRSPQSDTRFELNLPDLDFRVRFKNQPESEDRWFSQRQIMRKGGLKAYWKYAEEHPELKIPKKR